MINKIAVSFEFEKTRTFDPRPEGIPDSFYVFTAPRPLAGTKTWRGSGGQGWHYSAVDPSDEFMKQNFLITLKRNAASFVEYVTEQDYLKWLESYFEDEAERKEVLADPELLEHYKEAFVKEAEKEKVSL